MGDGKVALCEVREYKEVKELWGYEHTRQFKRRRQ